MAIEKVKAYFEKYNMENRIQEFDVSSATVELAAGDTKIDNSKYKKQFGTKAKMLSPQEVETMVGHVCKGWEKR